MVAGVCGGLADWLGWDVIVVRLVFVLVAAVSSVVPALLAYFTLWLVIPENASPRHYVLDLWDEFY
jgi:phage shock protein PspC (stress-responsive transcriptional regulator)